MPKLGISDHFCLAKVLEHSTCLSMDGTMLRALARHLGEEGCTAWVLGLVSTLPSLMHDSTPLLKVELGRHHWGADETLITPSPSSRDADGAGTRKQVVFMPIQLSKEP